MCYFEIQYLRYLIIYENLDNGPEGIYAVLGATSNKQLIAFSWVPSW